MRMRCRTWGDRLRMRQHFLKEQPGKLFSGFQKQQRMLHGKIVRTIQGQLEVALRSLNPTNDVVTKGSSRTDAGVHALENTLHVDLECKTKGTEFDPDLMKYRLNYWLRKNNESIRVSKVLRVSDDFHCRMNVKGRSYMYRLAIPWKEIPAHSGYSGLSLLESDRSKIIWKPLDINKLMAAAELMVGTHDFTAFTTIKSLRTKNECPIKTVSINVKLGKTTVRQYNPGLEFWEVHVHSRSFLFRQIRRMVGAMIQVALDRLTLDDIRHALLDPNLNTTATQIDSLRPEGLYMTSVQYDPADLIYKPSPEAESVTGARDDDSSDSSDDLFEDSIGKP